MAFFHQIVEQPRHAERASTSVARPRHRKIKSWSSCRSPQHAAVEARRHPDATVGDHRDGPDRFSKGQLAKLAESATRILVRVRDVLAQPRETFDSDRPLTQDPPLTRSTLAVRSCPGTSIFSGKSAWWSLTRASCPRNAIQSKRAMCRPDAEDGCKGWERGYDKDRSGSFVSNLSKDGGVCGICWRVASRHVTKGEQRQPVQSGVSWGKGQRGAGERERVATASSTIGSCLLETARRRRHGSPKWMTHTSRLCS